ncbi:MAG: hypothetical protein KGD74_06155 [Candidatus Lokiarchaeota archaeon]|nr:hypothetical protein [Candidatus Lokiarchaeota archaeon]
MLTFQFLTEFAYTSFVSEFGNYSLHFILETNPDFFQLAGIIFLINLIIMAFIIFVFSLLNFIFRTFRLIFSKRKIESIVSVVSYYTYGVYLFHRIFLVIFTAIMTTGLNIDMREQNNFYLVLIFILFIVLFSYLIQKALDWVWKLVSRRTTNDNL